MLTRSTAILISVAAAAIYGSANAALPTGTLSFTQPTGTALTTDNIEVWLRLTIDPTSVPLFLDSSLPNNGLDLADLNTVDEQWVTVTAAQTTAFYSCAGTFNAGCAPSRPYQFSFDYTPPDSFVALQNINMAAGSSLDYHFGTFLPVGGAAASGTYSFYGAYATLYVAGEGYKPAVDADGNYIYDSDGNIVFDTSTLVSLIAYHDIASTNCGPNPSDPCPGFSREVLAAVPEPESYAMMLAGLVFIGAAARARKRSA